MGDAGPSDVSAQGQAFLNVVREGRSFSGRERHCLFLNNADGSFSDVSSVVEFDLPDDGRSLAQVDWDQDGDLDFWIANRNGPQVRFLENRSSANQHFLSVQLEGTESNRDAIGSRVRVYVANDDRPVTRTLRAGDSFLAQSSKRLHFGLGDAVSIERIEVTWPNGTTQSFAGPNINSGCLIRQGEADVHSIDMVARSLSRAKQTLPMQTGVGGSHSAVSFSMIAFPTDKLTSLDGRSGPLLNPAARMTLVNIWASWCGPCVSELTDIAENASALQQRGIDVVALSVDAITDQATLDGTVTLLQKLKFPYRSGVVDQALATKLQLLNDTIFEIRDPLPVPTSFLLDRKRRVLIVYKGPVSVEQLLHDIGGLKASSTEEWRSATVPFTGYWFMPPRRRHLFDYVQQLVDLGFKDEAIDYVQRDPEMFTKHPYWPTLNQKLQP